MKKISTLFEDENLEGKKPIELYYFVNPFFNPPKFSKAESTPNNFTYVKLIARGPGYDTIACFDEISEENVRVYLGRWNDGIK